VLSWCVCVCAAVAGLSCESAGLSFESAGLSFESAGLEVPGRHAQHATTAFIVCTMHTMHISAIGTTLPAGCEIDGPIQQQQQQQQQQQPPLLHSYSSRAGRSLPL
jgi:hypothetical protein